jgi:hypothetical protein
VQKNVASQKWVCFAFDETTNTAVTGDAANITAKISADGAAGVATNDTNPTEIEDGYYVFDLTQAETNADLLLLLPESSTANTQVIGVPGTVWTRPPNFSALGIEADGDLSKVEALETGSITATVIATDAVDADALATDAVTEINAGAGARVIDVLTQDELLRRILAILSGNYTGARDRVVVYKRQDGTTTEATATVTGDARTIS